MAAPESGTGHRIGCLNCGEPVLVHARICPHCKTSALVDVLGRHPLDDRLRYSLSRALVKAPAGVGRDLASIQRSLRESPPVLAVGVTREIAAQTIELARGLGLEAVEDLAPTPLVASRKKVPGSLPAWVWVAAGCVLFARLAFWLFQRGAATYGTATAVPAPVPPPAVTTDRSIDQFSEHPAAIRQALNSVVAIRCGQQSGSGFYVGPDLVLTNNHVLCGPGVPVQVSMMDGRRALGQVQRTDAYLDLGLVKVHHSGTVRPLPVIDAASLEVGRHVFLIGSPVGLDFTVHEGQVSRVGQHLLGLGYVQIDASVNPGNSGGPLLDEEGRVVGVVSLKVEGEGLGLALPINYAFEYKGRSLLAPPPGWVPSEAFRQLSLKAEIEDVATDSLVAASVVAPFIMRVKSDQYSRPVILVGRFAENAPPSEDFKFLIRVNGNVVCTRPAHTARWEEQLQKLDLPPRLAEWMRERRIDMKIYTTELSPGLSGCPDLSRIKATIDLEGGQEFQNTDR